MKSKIPAVPFLSAILCCGFCTSSSSFLKNTSWALFSLSLSHYYLPHSSSVLYFAVHSQGWIQAFSPVFEYRPPPSASLPGIRRKPRNCRCIANTFQFQCHRQRIPKHIELRQAIRSIRATVSQKVPEI